MVGHSGEAPQQQGHGAQHDVEMLQHEQGEIQGDPPPPVQNGHWAQIPVAQQQELHDDEAYGDELIDETSSIASTIYRHRFEHGRRYSKFREDSYWGPNDDTQNDQLDIAHHMLRILLDDKLYVCPVKYPQRVLDVGCGTGIWAIDFADEHPQAEVVGVDISPIQPEFVPPNCRFELDDVCAEWTFPPDHFDFIHVRCLFGSVADWPKLYEEIYNHMTPGGYICQLEMDIQFKSDDGTVSEGHIMHEWSQKFIAAGEKFGKTFKIAERCKQHILNAGFEDVHEVKWKLPVGGWSSDPKMKDLGRWNFLHCYQGAEGWALFLCTHILGWKVEEARIFIAQFKNACKDRNNHAYFDVVSVYGRKPYE